MFNIASLDDLYESVDVTRYDPNDPRNPTQVATGQTMFIIPYQASGNVENPQFIDREQFRPRYSADVKPRNDMIKENDLITRASGEILVVVRVDTFPNINAPMQLVLERQSDG